MSSSTNIFINAAVVWIPGSERGRGDLLELEAYVYQADFLSKATRICD